MLKKFSFYIYLTLLLVSHIYLKINLHIDYFKLFIVLIHNQQIYMISPQLLNYE